MLVAKHCAARPHVLLVHGRIGSRSDVGQAQGRVRGGVGGSGRIVFLGRSLGRVLGHVGRVGEGNVLLVGPQAGRAGARVGMRRVGRVLGLVGVGARGQRVLLGVAGNLGLGRRGGGGGVGGGGAWPRLLLCVSASGLQRAWHGWRAVGASLGCSRGEANVGRGAVLVGRVVLRLGEGRVGCGRGRGSGCGCGDVKLLVGRASEGRGAPRRFVAGLRQASRCWWRCVRHGRRVLLLLVW